MSRVREVLYRLLVRVLARTRGELRARQDLRNLDQILRFIGVFSVLIFVPVVLLAYQALYSIEAQEVSDVAALHDRADVFASQVTAAIGDAFFEFQVKTDGRIESGIPVVDAIHDLSPQLRLAARFSPQGELVAPFVRPKRQPLQSIPAYQRFILREAQSLESLGDFSEAASQYSLAAVAGDRGVVGEAEFARVRSLWKGGLLDNPLAAFDQVYADYGDARTQHGFRLGDLIQLKKGEILLQRDPEAGRLALQALIDQIRAARWAIGSPGEVTVARRALGLLEGEGDPTWTAGAQAELSRRLDQFLWANRVVDELGFMAATPPRAGQRFQYHPQEKSLWVSLWHQSTLWAFSFDYELLQEVLVRAINAAHDENPEIEGKLVHINDPRPPEVLARRSLAPYMPFGELVVLPSDRAALAKDRSKKRGQRIFITLLAVGTAVLGVVLSATIVLRELEGARIKSDFAANVSHELRSPITQIRLKGESLQLDLVIDDEDRQAHYDAIVNEAERLSRLVDNVLDYASIERGAKRYALRPDDISEIVQATVESARGTVESKGIELELDVPHDLPRIWVDRHAIGQVITNLLSNAVKYGGDGGWVGVRAREGLESVEISVADKGMGIHPDDLSKIFDDFFRSTDAAVRKRRGTGIGLSIVRYIVDAHGGSIGVESDIGQGTTFTVTLPLDPPPEAGA